jgi:hypothetical protein
MGHKKLTYLDISPTRRRATASKALTNLKDALGNPALTSEQALAIRLKITRLNQWADGKLGQNPVELAEEEAHPRLPIRRKM